ncbi:MAG TPA: alpha/beta hydrolase [Ktedonobacteraceae bacterium]|nr:alpha/beta hydrolase [Ktedonobacteraceae bacterium]
MTCRQPEVLVDASSFQADVEYLETLFQHQVVGDTVLPLIDIGRGIPLIFVPILEHLEFVYARQVRFFSQQRRVILYRRRETRRTFTGREERVEELRGLLNHLEIMAADFVAHGDGAMVLLEFAMRYPQRCRSLTIVAQGAEYQIRPHPWIWLLHELYLRLPVEHILSADFLRRTVVNYIVARQPSLHSLMEEEQLSVLPRALIEDQFRKINDWPAVYKYSVLPVIHSFDIRKRLDRLTMPVLLINRFDDVLAPEARTRWFAQHLPNCAGYHVIAGGERFFLYSQAATVNRIIQDFLERGAST